MRRLVRFGGYLLLFGVVFAAAWVRLPYYAVGPGPAREITPLIHVEGAPTYASSGRYVMTTEQFTSLTALGVVAAWIDPGRGVVDEDAFIPPGLSAEEEEHRAISEMDQSKIAAARVVLAEVSGYPEDHGRGALIEFVGAECPADRHLFPGDRILRIEGEVVDSSREASRLIDRIPVGEPIEFRIDTEGEISDVRVARGRCPGEDEPRLGIVLVDAFPFEISIESGDVGGPSAGLMWALALYDLLTAGDLTRGRTIAGTGTIDPDGDVGPIGAVADKLLGAQEIEADIMLVPRSNLGELRGVDRGEVTLVPVSTFREALDALEASESAT